jgi:hypothetical protein
LVPAWSDVLDESLEREPGESLVEEIHRAELAGLSSTACFQRSAETPGFDFEDGSRGFQKFVQGYGKRLPVFVEMGGGCRAFIVVFLFLVLIFRRWGEGDGIEQSDGGFYGRRWRGRGRGLGWGDWFFEYASRERMKA